MTREQAIEALKNRQSTFGLDKCKNRWGEVEGEKRWQDRQDKWQVTLNAKSEEDKMEMNRSKAPRLNTRLLRSYLRGKESLADALLQTDSFLYVMQFGSYLKVGFSIAPSRRLRTVGLQFTDKKIVKTFSQSALRNYTIEQLFHLANKDMRVDPRIYNGPGYSEMYDRLSVDEILNQIDSLNMLSDDELIAVYKNDPLRTSI